MFMPTICIGLSFLHAEESTLLTCKKENAAQSTPKKFVFSKKNNKYEGDLWFKNVENPIKMNCKQVNYAAPHQAGTQYIDFQCTQNHEDQDIYISDWQVQVLKTEPAPNIRVGKGEINIVRVDDSVNDIPFGKMSCE